MLNAVLFFVVAATLFILPFLYNNESKSFHEFLVMFSTELISPILAFFIVDFKSIGRVTLLNIALLLGALNMYAIYFYTSSVLISGMSLFRVIIRF